MQIGWIGLGQMGLPMARNAIKEGHSLIVWNRTRSRAESLVQLGARVADSATEATAPGLVVTMLSDDHATEDVAFGPKGIIAALGAGGIHVAMSTISVSLAKRLTHAHREAGQVYVSSPVFGRPEAAAAQKLAVIPAGPPEALAKLKPLFDAVGQGTFVMGEEPSAANVAKLSGNFLIAAMIESLGEAVTLVRKSGLDAARYMEMITSTLFNAPAYKTYGALIASDNYQPVGFKMALGLKDVRLVLAAAEAAQTPMPVASLVRDRMLSGLARGRGNEDWSSFARLIAENAGL
ncbi:MAG: NAD(P)-dependent oxidoreductase [Acidobacteriota bacterium]|nr:NAD(P)-dependent oxidoreductase [Acidobacteriota bacterium]